MKKPAPSLLLCLSASVAAGLAGGCGSAGARPLSTVAARSAAESSRLGAGVLDLAVAWPSRARYVAQTIPLSTDQIAVTVTGTGDGAGVELATASLSPDEGATASLSLPPGLVGVEAEAFAGQTLVASASTEAQIQAGVHTGARLSLAPVYIPVVSSLSPTPGWPGATVTLAGSELSEPWASTPSITVGGIPATVSSAGAPAVSFLVPDLQPGTYSVSLTSDGVAAQGSPVLEVQASGSAPGPSPTPGSSATAASVTIGAGASAITYTAVTPGTVGNGIVVWQFATGYVAISEQNQTIIVDVGNLTAAEVAAAVNSTPEAAALVQASTPGGGSGLPVAGPGRLSGGTGSPPGQYFNSPDVQDMNANTFATVGFLSGYSLPDNTYELRYSVASGSISWQLVDASVAFGPVLAQQTFAAPGPSSFALVWGAGNGITVWPAGAPVTGNDAGNFVVLGQ